MNDQEKLIEAACEVMHNAYEEVAVGAGWETQTASRKPWSEVPEANKKTMRAAVSALLDWLVDGFDPREKNMDFNEIDHPSTKE